MDWRKTGLTDAYDGKAMGNAAELCAATCGISREEQDNFAIASYRRSQAAWADGKFSEEVVPVARCRSVRAIRSLFGKDEEPYNVRFDKIPELKPSFQPDGTVTAANASTLNDGAAALLLMSGEKGEGIRAKPAGEDPVLCRCRTSAGMVHHHTVPCCAESGCKSRPANGGYRVLGTKRSFFRGRN
jgi:acetyl-CoA acetyltransferase